MKCVELSKDKWECVADGPRDPATNKRNQIRRRGRTKSITKKIVEEEIRKQEMLGGYTKKIEFTFEEAAIDWMDTYVKSGVKKRTIVARDYHVRVLFRYLKNAKIKNITASMCQKIFNDLYNKGFKKGTYEQTSITANMVFSHAIKHGYLIDNPNAHVVLPVDVVTIEDLEKDRMDEKYLNREELKEFLNITKEKGLNLDVERFYLFAFTGIRSGELCALKWNDINFKNNEIRIIKTLYNKNSKMDDYELTPPKSDAGIRTIRTDPKVMRLLKEHKKRQSELFLSTAKKYPERHKENFVFCRANGYPFTPKNVHGRMERLIEYTSIKKNATPHMFRHTHVSMLTEAGVELPTIMERVGHEDVNTTLKIYTHISNKMKKKAADKIGDEFSDYLAFLSN